MKPLNTPIYQSTVYSYESAEEMREVMLSASPHFYMRSGNVTVQAVGEKIAALEKAEEALLFSSGMAAIACALTSLLQSGDHIVVHKDVFSQTMTFINSVLLKYNVTASYVDANDRRQLQDAILPTTRIIYIETPSNPKISVTDIRYAAKIAGENSTVLIVDSTYASPVLQLPLQLGASLVIHSATKFLAGHADLLGGVLAGSKKIIDLIRPVHKLMGGVMDPQVAFLLERGLKTLVLRMERISWNALHIAEYLSQHSKVKFVNYPFLKDDIYYELASSQMKSGSGVLSFELKDGLEGGRVFINHLKLIRIATSLGSTDSVIEIPYDLKRIRQPFEENRSLIRLSAGIEDKDDLIADLSQALEKV